MRKDKEWLKEEIGKSALSSWFDKLRLDMNIIELEFLIDELDEPETDYTISELVKANKMLSERIDNLVKELNDKAEQTNKNPDSVRPVIPQFVAYYIENNKGKEFSLGTWLNFVNLEYGFESETEEWLYSGSYEEQTRREHLLIDAIRYGYEVEKEKLYNVVNKENYFMLRKYDGLVDTMQLSPTMSRDEFGKDTRFMLTEQEIKDYDKRFWALRKPVEELEE